MHLITLLCLLLVGVHCTLAIDVDDIEEEVENARENENLEDSEDDDDDAITLGEVKELEEKLRDPLWFGGRRRRRRSWRGRRFIERVTPFVPLAVSLAGKKDQIERISKRNMERKNNF